MHLLVFQQPRQRRSVALICLVCALFTMSTIHIVLVLVRALHAFIAPQNQLKAALYYANSANGLNIFKDALSAVNA